MAKIQRKSTRKSTRSSAQSNGRSHAVHARAGSGAARTSAAGAHAGPRAEIITADAAGLADLAERILAIKGAPERNSIRLGLNGAYAAYEAGPVWRPILHESTNRDLNPQRIEMYRNAMSMARWLFTADPVVITKSGMLINGQHRLAAALALAREVQKETELAQRQAARAAKAAPAETEESDALPDPDDLVRDPRPAPPAPQFVVVWGVEDRTALLMDESKRSNEDRRTMAMRFAESVQR